MRAAAMKRDVQPEPATAPAAEPIIEVRDVSKIYGNSVTALAGINLTFETGKLTSLLGPSGCGKTTLLKIVAGLLPPSGGEILVKGKPITGPGPERAFVFQDFALMPWATVLRNAAFGLQMQGMDEPFSAVDEQTRRKFQEDLIRLREVEKKTFLFVTHSIEEAVYVSDRIVILSPRPGKVSQIIDPAIPRGIGPDELRRDPVYLDTVEEIWHTIKKYVE